MWVPIAESKGFIVIQVKGLPVVPSQLFISRFSPDERSLTNAEA
jgi:hypothetical protein